MSASGFSANGKCLLSPGRRLFGNMWSLWVVMAMEGASGSQWAEPRTPSKYGLVLHNPRRLLAQNSNTASCWEGQKLQSSSKDDTFRELLEAKVSFFLDISNHIKHLCLSHLLQSKLATPSSWELNLIKDPKLIIKLLNDQAINSFLQVKEKVFSIIDCLILFNSSFPEFEH